MSICQTCLDGLVSNHNVVEDSVTTDDGDSLLTLLEWRSITGQDANSVTVLEIDSLFVNSPSGDFHLVNSVAVDIGENLAMVPDDLEGNPRPAGPAHDAGCYEKVD